MLERDTHAPIKMDSLILAPTINPAKIKTPRVAVNNKEALPRANLHIDLSLSNEKSSPSLNTINTTPNCESVSVCISS